MMLQFASKAEIADSAVSDNAFSIKHQQNVSSCSQNLCRCICSKASQ